MELLTAFRLSADHYQFFVHDSEADPCPESFYEERDDARTTDYGSYELGYITNGQSICFGTCAHLNRHWIEVFHSEQVPDWSLAQRVIALPLAINSGQACVSNLIGFSDPRRAVVLRPGAYTVYLLGFSLGRDQAAEPPWPQEIRKFTDAEYAARRDFEHYQIVFVPGDTTAGKLGVVHGAPNIATARQMADQQP